MRELTYTGMASTHGATPTAPSDRDCWFEALAGAGPARDIALFRLHAFLVAVGWFELERRRNELVTLSTADAARLVRDAADAACATLLGRLGNYHGQSRFDVWAAKFAIHETAAAARRSVATASKRAAARDTDLRTHSRASDRGGR